MSGTRYHNFREGDRSEYLAIYLLSAIGLVTEVPRQEDIGFDLICNIAERESGIIAYRNHYAVSVKSASTPNVIFDPPESREESTDYADHYSWLFHLEIPLMLAIVDKDKQKLSLYSTLPAWFVFYEKLSKCGILELIPRMPKTELKGDVGRPFESGPEPKAGGRNRYKVDLGYPIIELSIADLQDNAVLVKKKKSLRRAVELGALSASLAGIKTPCFFWFNMTIPGGYDDGKSNPDGYNGGTAIFVGTSKGPKDLERMLINIAYPLASAAMLFKSSKKTDYLMALRDVLRLLPANSLPDSLKKELPEIFE